jgi:hypothetical protein
MPRRWGRPSAKFAAPRTRGAEGNEREPHNQWAAVDASVEAKICQASRLLATSDKVT